MLVNEYAPNGKCTLSSESMGMLRVYAVELSGPTEAIPGKSVKFMVAIQDRETGTFTMFAQRSYHAVDAATVLKQCKPGDQIVIITLDREWSLPHGTILVQ
ncbi:MAG: hypothetical protein IPL65_00035 [Lewinellaceae bacterium]|nr:hypothetical protein [Lewinellaceae bacterium]